MPPKTTCPVSLSQFTEKAQALKITINGQDQLADAVVSMALDGLRTVRD